MTQVCQSILQNILRTLKCIGIQLKGNNVRKHEHWQLLASFQIKTVVVNRTAQKMKPLRPAKV